METPAEKQRETLGNLANAEDPTRCVLEHVLLPTKHCLAAGVCHFATLLLWMSTDMQGHCQCGLKTLYERGARPLFKKANLPEAFDRFPFLGCLTNERTWGTEDPPAYNNNPPPAEDQPRVCECHTQIPLKGKSSVSTQDSKKLGPAGLGFLIPYSFYFVCWCWNLWTPRGS